MSFRLRFFSALKAGALHLLSSLVVMLAVAALVFNIWYPPPFNQVQGGFTLFLIVATVDVICGPLLTMVFWNPTKTHKEILSDLSLVVIIQIAALAYGLHAVAIARPLFVAYERDHFQVVSAADLRDADIITPSQKIQPYSWTGPKVIGVKLYDGSHPKFLESVQLSLMGVYPAFQPSRWLEYKAVQKETAERAHPLTDFISNQTSYKGSALTLSKSSGVPSEHMGYLPLNGFMQSDWSVIIDKRDGRMLGYLPFNGWPLD